MCVCVCVCVCEIRLSSEELKAVTHLGPEDLRPSLIGMSHRVWSGEEGAIHLHDSRLCSERLFR